MAAALSSGYYGDPTFLRIPLSAHNTLRPFTECPRPSNPFWCPISNVDYLRLIVLPLRHDVVCTSVVTNLPCWYSSNKDDIAYVRTKSSAIRS
eukprot:scaffold2570_cov223-Alexandrium_tamarense.AAC.1